MLLAWDQTKTLNWGHRSAPLALHQILSLKFNDIEFMSGKFRHAEQRINFLFPDWITDRIQRRVNSSLAAKAYMRVETLLGGKTDYLGSTPSASVDALLANKDKGLIRELYQTVCRHEVIVIDGNGDMLLRSNPKRNLRFTLALIELASRLDKEVYYINSMFSDWSLESQRNRRLADQCVNMLKKCKAVAFRDPTSLEKATQIAPNLNSYHFPDSLFYWYKYIGCSSSQVPKGGGFIVPYPEESVAYLDGLNFEVPYICITGGARAAYTQIESYRGYCKLIEEARRLDIPLYLVPTCNGDRFLYEVAEETGVPIIPTETPVLMGGAILANARLFITGRYHPSILASLGGTPCIFLGADSHKTLSLQKILEYDDPKVFSAIPTAQEYEDMLVRSRDFLSKGDEIRNQIQQKAKECAKQSTDVLSLIEANNK